MNDREFNDTTFSQALARARVAEAAELAAAARGVAPHANSICPVVALKKHRADEFARILAKI